MVPCSVEYWGHLPGSSFENTDAKYEVVVACLISDL